MADGRHLEKSKNGHISATARPICTKFVWPIGAKFDKATHIGPANRTGS